MKSEPPPGFQRRLRSHNLHVLLGAFLAFLAATGLWLLLFHAGQFAILGYLTIAREDHTAPAWYSIGFAAVMTFILSVVLLDRAFRPFRRLKDRPIIGWHLLGEIFLLPANLALAISDNIRAYRKVGKCESAFAWAVLCELFQNERLRDNQLLSLGLPERETRRALLTLQLCGLVDLHQGKEHWFYKIRSTELETVRQWIGST